LYFATGNRAKLAQFRWVAARLGSNIEIASARAAFGEAAHYQEVGDTEQEIARQGALSVAARTGVPIVAEDTGLHVAALDGRPGIRAGQYLRDAGRVGLLRELTGVADRRAEIVAALAYATPDGDWLEYERRVVGTLIQHQRWTSGLPDWIGPTREDPYGGGYNCIFVPQGEVRTLAEIPPREALDVGYREPNFAALLEALGALPSVTCGGQR
jgi:XTP/dITP diphosphohydrolase